MNGQRVGYVRVSTFEQNAERQLDGVELDRTFTDKASGKDTKRPQLDALLTFVRLHDLHRHATGKLQQTSTTLSLPFEGAR